MLDEVHPLHKLIDKSLGITGNHDQSPVPNSRLPNVELGENIRANPCIHFRLVLHFEHSKSTCRCTMVNSERTWALINNGEFRTPR